MVNKFTVAILFVFSLTIYLSSQVPRGVQQVTPGVPFQEATVAEEDLIDIELDLFSRPEDYNILSPRGIESIYYLIEEDDIIAPFQRKIIGDAVPRRVSLPEEDYEELRVDVWNRTRLLMIDTQGQSRDLAGMWYAYWRLFNAWEDYIERYIIEEPLDNRSARLPKYIINAPDDEEFDPQSARHSQTMPMGAMGTAAPGMMMGGPEMMQTTQRTPRGRVQEPEVVLPPVITESAKARIEELNNSHREQLQRVINFEHNLEKIYQARTALKRAQIETYHNWKDEQTVEMLYYLHDLTGLINFEFEE